MMVSQPDSQNALYGPDGGQGPAVDDLYARCMGLINQLPGEERMGAKEELDAIDFNVERLQERIAELEQRVQGES